MKKFEKPEVQIERFDIADVISSSIGCGSDNCPNLTPCPYDE